MAESGGSRRRGNSKLEIAVLVAVVAGLVTVPYLLDRLARQLSDYDRQPGSSVEETEEECMAPSPVLTPDGRYVFFETSINSLVPGDTNGCVDVFRRDLRSGAVVRASVGPKGEQWKGHSFAPSPSADGSVVAFTYAPLGKGGKAYREDHEVVVKSLTTGAVTHPAPSVKTEGFVWPASDQPTLSGDGHTLAFAASGKLLPEDTSNLEGIYLADLARGKLSMPSPNSGPKLGMDHSDQTVLSGDGRYLFYRAQRYDLLKPSSVYSAGLLRRDLRTGDQTPVVPLSSDFSVAVRSDPVSVSRDGQRVVYTRRLTAKSGDLDGGGRPWTPHAMLTDLKTHRTVRLDPAGKDKDADLGARAPAISAQGRYVVFMSAEGLGHKRNERQVYWNDTQTGTLRLASCTAAGVAGKALSGGQTVSEDGRYVAFDTTAANLLPGKSRAPEDVVVKDMKTGELFWATRPGTPKWVAVGR
jgi:Tol biopolymer transport system component